LWRSAYSVKMLSKERGSKTSKIQRGDVFILLAAVVFMLQSTEIESSRYFRIQIVSWDHYYIFHLSLVLRWPSRIYDRRRMNFEEDRKGIKTFIIVLHVNFGANRFWVICKLGITDWTEPIQYMESKVYFKVCKRMNFKCTDFRILWECMYTGQMFSAWLVQFACPFFVKRRCKRQMLERPCIKLQF
jgi:hypothetical protein